MSSMGKGQQTKEVILQNALEFVSKLGLESLSIGELAKRVGMSKSGLFGHFNSKEKLQQMVLDYAATNFVNEVMKPAFSKKRGVERIYSIVENWINWSETNFSGGCPFVAAAFEYDDRPGPIRDYITQYQKDMIKAFSKAASIAIEEGEFKADLDADQFAYEFYSMMLGLHLYHRLLNDEQAMNMHNVAFEALMKRSSTSC